MLAHSNRITGPSVVIISRFIVRIYYKAPLLNIFEEGMASKDIKGSILFLNLHYRITANMISSLK